MTELPEKVIVRARREDPETSHEAAAVLEANQERALSSVACVVRMLQEHGRLSDFGIRELWPNYWGNRAWSYTLPSKARHWARQAGLVKHDGYGEHEGRRVRMWSLGRDEAFFEHQSICPRCGRRMRPR